MILAIKNRFKDSLKVGSNTSKESDEVDMEGITNDKMLYFRKYIKNLYCTTQ